MKIIRFALAAVLWTGLLEATRATPYYVATNGAGGDFLSWEQAANNIQDAISKATTANDIVWVSNGVYETGGVTNWPPGTILTNRVAITNAITVMSANNDPTNTIIRGAWASDFKTNGPDAVRCVYIMNSSSAKLIGFMLTNGATLTNTVAGDAYSYNSGGMFSPGTGSIISNCVIAGNSARGRGGGVYGGTLYKCTVSDNHAMGDSSGGGTYYSTLCNCLLTGNSAGGGIAGGGGGAYYCTLYNCTLTGNRASSGGGAGGSPMYNCLLTGNSASGNGGGAYNGDTKMYNCTVVSNSTGGGGGGVYDGSQLYNCIVYFNYSPTAGRSNWYSTVNFTNSCTAPTTTVWAAGNTTENPMLVDTNRANYNYRLSPNSPCINKGTNYSWMADGGLRSIDLDGRTRIRYGTVDMGAYERINAGTIYKLW